MSALPATLYSRKPVALARHGLHVTSSKSRTASLHVVTPSLVQATWTEGGEMYSAPQEKFSTRDEHLKRVADALERRLYPHTPLHQKVLAGAIGVTRHTVNNWLRGKCDPGSHEMDRLGKFFKSTEGSPLFLIEIYGDLAAPRSQRSAAE